MGCIRPATPGFLVTLVATILLAVVSFCVPYFKSIYFLRADISVSHVNGSITFGTLGYCLELSNGTSCSKPSIGYQLDINGLVGNHFDVKIPQVAVKWLTYALFLHVIGLIISAISTIFGLLAHVREMSMTCCSTCISGFAAVVTLFAFIFDIVLFFIAKARINAVGHASMGNAIWLTLAAWLLLFFSGCFFAVGRCCISKRGPRNWSKKDGKELDGPDTAYAEHMRMEAIKAEANRKTKQASNADGGLPAFYETVPLTSRIEGDSVYTDKDDTANHRAGGYAPAPQGTRAVDEYYTPTSAYPPLRHPERQGSSYSHATSTYPQNSPTVATTSPPLPTNNQYLTDTAYDPFSNHGPHYGHTAGGSSYQTAISHDRQASAYSPHDSHNNYGSQLQPQTTHYVEPSFNPDIYNNTGILNTSQSPPMLAGATNPYMSTPNSYTTYATQSPPPQQYTTQSPPPQQYTQHSSPSQQYTSQRQYSLSGDGYDANSVPSLPAQNNSSYVYTGVGTSSGSYTMPTSAAQDAVSRTPATDASRPNFSDAPPDYDAGTSNVRGYWGKA